MLSSDHPDSTELAVKNVPLNISADSAVAVDIVKPKSAVPPIAISISNLSYHVGPKEASKTILNNLSATFGPAKVIAVLGASGAGKTTLLNMLAGSVGQGRMEGSITLNGRPADSRILRKVSCYCLQDELLFSALTAKETLQDAARLRIRQTPANPNSRQEKVDEMLHLFGLEEAQNVIVGSPEGVRGLSGGQRKRLSVAVEVLAEPALIYCDEPTSGLDVQASFQMIQQLNALARRGHTVICTIHQPSSRIFNLFDEVMLLGKGEILFHGPVPAVIEFFAQNGFVCPAYHNPADFIVETSAAFTPDEFHRVVESNRTQYNQKQGQRQHELEALPVISYPERSYAASNFEMFTILLWRLLRVMLRDKLVTRFRFTSHMMVGFVTGLLWLDQRIHPLDPSSVQNRIGLMFFVNTFLLLNSVIPTVLTFPLFRAVFQKEHRNNWYSVPSYFLAQTLASLPYQIFLPLLYSGILYGMCGLRSDAVAVVRFLFMCVLQAIVGQSLGVFISCVAPTVTFAIVSAPISVMPQLLFSGFLANINQMPIPIVYLQYISFFRYSLEALITAQFEDYTVREGAAVYDGNTVFPYLGFGYGNYGRNVGILFGFALFFQTVAFIVLRKKVKAA